MSDGPHRSLPMRPHWKKLAERTANLAHTDYEVCEALTHALKRDVLSGPIDDVRRIMGTDTLLPEFRVDLLEALRSRHPGSPVASSLIDCAIESANAGIAGDTGTIAAVAGAMEELARPALRGIDEHYQREARARTSRIMRPRLEAAMGQVNCADIARDLLSSARAPSRRSVVLPTRTGLDEGPPL